jgi:ubiquinone/menaquinone biosynthesis C-methylase UbiE
LLAPGLAGVFIPLRRRDAGGYILRHEADGGGPGLPLPPPQLREGYGLRPDGTPDDARFLEQGREHVAAMRAALEAAGFRFGPGQRLLDFGCATGRMLRWFEDQASASEVWGADVNAADIAWCQQHLSPPFHFVTTTFAPHLPFEDNSFDLIYAGSVFTHIAELADAWLLELRRILRSGAFAFITIFDDTSVDVMLARGRHHKAYPRFAEFSAATNLLATDYDSFSFSPGPRDVRVGYHRQRLLTKLARWFDVRHVQDEAYNWQTGIALQKPPAHRPHK